MAPPGRWVCLDVGETLIDETRVWSVWADVLAIPRLTFMAALGAVIARGGEHRDVFGVFGLEESAWRGRMPEVEARYGGFRAEDLYPDALPAIQALAAAGYRLAVLANQPAARTAELRGLGIAPEVIAMSDEMGIAKPDPAFFTRALELMGGAAPGDVAYVGDRVDNDVLPAMAAGMRAVWLRRGPWGHIQELPPDMRPALVVQSLDELVNRIGDVLATS
ncbi:MAG TPA: HAD family hydrolase [Candidatus Limnocylindria bacterium]|nr:HAD family hydrolase [Candidatus Limnocylindria bacterium]